MKKRILGRTGLEISVMGMGTGGHDPLGQRRGRDKNEMINLIHSAKNLGISFFDTSPGYLESEVILGEALRDFSREEFVVSTKIPLAGGHTDDVHVMTPEEVSESVDSSLKRLGLDHIDIMLMAVAGPEYYDPVVNDLIPVLQKAKRDGKIGYIGSSEQTRSDGSHEWLKRILRTGFVDVAMVGHNMINQSAQQTIFPLCRRDNIGVINIFTVRNLFWNPERLEQVIADLKRRGIIDAESVPDRNPLGFLIDDESVNSLVEAAYRYALHTDPVTTVMCGTIELNELEENVKSIEKPPLPEYLRKRLSDIFGNVAEPIGN